MALSLTAEQKELIKIFDIEEQYIIPAYQRPYSWGYDECFTLYNDIVESFRNDEDYFIGNLVIARSENNKEKLDVIDGQQRLTSLLLLIKVLSVFFPDHKALKKCLEKEDWETDEVYPRIKSEVFEAEDEINLTETLKYTKDDFALDFMLLADRTGKVSTKKCKHKFQYNILILYGWIVYFDKTDNLNNLVSFLLKRVYLLPIELSGKTTEEARNRALKIFETLNNRGKSLTDADIFKAKLYGLAQKKGEQNNFIESWKDLNDSCELVGVKVDDIFKYYSHIIRGKEGKTTSEINLRDFFEKEKYSPFNLKSYQSILDDLFLIIEVIEFIDKEKTQETSLSKWIQLVDIYTNQYPRIALVVYLFINKPTTENKIELKVFIKKVIRYVYYAGSTTTVKFEIYNIIKDVCHNRNIEYYTFKEIKAEDFEYLGALKNAFALLAFYAKRKYALGKFYIDKIVTVKDTEYLDSTWDEKTILENNTSLGNFVILDIPKKNMAINKKAEYYKKSNIKRVKLLSNKLNSYSLEEFKKRDAELKNILVEFFRGKNDQKN